VRSAERTPRRGLPLAAHAGLLVAGLALALAVAEREVPFTVDEGSYAIQAEAVADGGWAIHWPFRTEDPEATHFPYHGGRVTDTAEFAYVSHPGWPAALSVARDVGPEGVGLRLLPLASVVAGAAVAWALARRIAGPGAAPWAFWVVAASPLLANGFIVWAHAPATAVAGVAVLATVQLGDGRRGPLPWLALVVAVAAGVLLRSELLLFAGALTAVLVAIGLRARRPALLGAGALAAATAGATLLAERAWIRDIAGRAGQDLGSRADGDGGLLSGRIGGAGTVLVEAASDSAGAAVCGLLAVALVAVAAVARRRGALWTGPPAVALLGGAAALTVLRAVVGPDDPVSGLLVAWPVVALLGLVGRAEDRRLLVLLGGSALFALAILATQYDDGGGLQWGGRYLAPLLVPLGVTVAVVVATRLAARERVAVAALLGATAVLSLVVPDQVRRRNADGIEAVDATGAEVVLVEGDKLARLDWAAWPERCWLADGDDLAGALDVARAAGVDRLGSLLVPIDELRALGAEAEPTAESAAALVVGLGATGARTNICSPVAGGR
jgi:hypothetical protein